MLWLGLLRPPCQCAPRSLSGSPKEPCEALFLSVSARLLGKAEPLGSHALHGLALSTIHSASWAYHSGLLACFCILLRLMLLAHGQ